MRRIVVGMDGSRCSGDALAWAAALAVGVGAEIVAVAAVHPRYFQVTSADIERLITDQRRALEDSWLAPVRSLVAARSAVLEGDPREVLLDTAATEAADLIVVGSTGLGGGPGLLHLGSVAEFLLHQSDRPVGVVPAGYRGPITRIGVGVDGSVANEAAVALTARIAAALQVPVTAIAVEEHSFGWEPADAGAASAGAAETAVAQRWASPIARAGVALEVVAVRGERPAAGLLRAAAEHRCDLLVVGARGLGGFPRLRAGGVATKVVHRADLPVLVVPAASDEP